VKENIEGWEFDALKTRQKSFHNIAKCIKGFKAKNKKLE
jgi:hypothetical protein